MGLPGDVGCVILFRNSLATCQLNQNPPVGGRMARKAGLFGAFDAWLTPNRVTGDVPWTLPPHPVTYPSLITVKHMVSSIPQDSSAEPKERELPEKLTLSIVVNGQPTQLTASPQASVESL